MHANRTPPSHFDKEQRNACLTTDDTQVRTNASFEVPTKFPANTVAIKFNLKIAERIAALANAEEGRSLTKIPAEAVAHGRPAVGKQRRDSSPVKFYYRGK